MDVLVFEVPQILKILFCVRLAASLPDTTGCIMFVILATSPSPVSFTAF